MDRNHPRALRTGPLRHFILKKSPDAVIPNEFKITNHTHLIFRPISFIQMSQIFTGENSAFEAIPFAHLLKVFAGLDLTPYAGDRLIDVCASATDTPV